MIRTRETNKVYKNHVFLNNKVMKMKYLRISPKQDLSTNRYCLLANVEDVDIIINYNPQCPFYIEQIAVLLDRNENKEIYDVFECGIEAHTDEEAKAIATSFAENLIKYRKQFKNYYDARIQEKNNQHKLETYYN